MNYPIKQKSELIEMKKAMSSGDVNPMELKKRLAREIVAQFNDIEVARDSERYFERTIQQKGVPEDICLYKVPSLSELEGKRLSHVLIDAKLASSMAEAKRLIDQGAIRINDQTCNTNVAMNTIPFENGDVIRAGRHRIVKVVRDDY